MVEKRDWTPVHVESRRGMGFVAVLAIFAVALGVALMFGLGYWKL